MSMRLSTTALLASSFALATPAFAAELEELTVTPAEATIWAGETQVFTATGHYDDGTTEDLTYAVTWNSSDTIAAYIDSSGVATGFSGGTTTITASLDGLSAEALLTVEPAFLVGLTLSPPTATIRLGETQQMTATGAYSDGTTSDLTFSASWESADPSVAVINDWAVVTGVGVGEATIVAVALDDESMTGTATIIVFDPDAPDDPVQVAAITHATFGGPAGQHLRATVFVVDADGLPIRGAAVSVEIEHEGGSAFVRGGITRNDGSVTFHWPNAPEGCFVTTVTDVAEEGWGPDNLANVSEPFCR